jgi:hypothetical protein
MTDVITLTEFYERKGFSEKDAVEKAEKQIRDERERAERERERERAERERERAFEIRKMEHEEKMKGISCHCSSIFLYFLMVSCCDFISMMYSFCFFCF